jgi:hypothetical protein
LDNAYEVDMADWYQETEAALDLVADALKKLRAKNPDHELLRWDDTHAHKEVPQDFFDRFGGMHVPEYHRGTVWARAEMLKNYYEALEAAAI